ncbi:MAG: CHASE2 domain-containing protein [Desulfobacterales bacterium]|nr:CHASE2 domain-containing protein [Desulfobacterales bacterium]MBF0395504.1 CHASE2 domain-containing protein [Desulfobacterales bacterium]
MHKKKIITSIIIALIIFSVIHLISTKTRLFVRLERGILNGLFYFREPAMTDVNPFVSQSTRLLGYDDDSIVIVGKWPWKRYVYADFLRKIEKFSPKTIMFDLFFVEREILPDFVKNNLKSDTNALKMVENVYSKMDQEFSDAMSLYDNVYIDLLLMEQTRSGLTKEFEESLKYNEEILKKFSQPVSDNKSSLVFNSMEPILKEYIKYANPVAVNALPDDDGVVRGFPLYCTYKMSDGSYRNLFSVVLSLLKRYYHIDVSDVVIKTNKIILNNAKVPIIDRKSHQPQIRDYDFEEINKKITNPSHLPDYKYNKNLVKCMTNLMAFAESGRMPHFPIHLVEKSDGSLEVIDGWEVLDSAKEAQASKIMAILYKEKNLEIKTPEKGFFYINYSGKEKRFHANKKTGKVETLTTIPTEGFHNVYTILSPPDIPDLDKEGNIVSTFNKKELYSWFIQFCEKTAQKEDGQYFLYNQFFKEKMATSENLEALIKDYTNFGTKAGQQPEKFLSEKLMVNSLIEYYTKYFSKYYNKFIFTGGTATGLGDIQPTPYASMFGINVIINAFNTIITENPLRMSTDIPYLDFILLITFCIIFSLFYNLSYIRISSYFFMGFITLTLIISVIMFEYKSIALKTSPLLLSNIVIFMITAVIKLLTEEKEKKFLKSTFSTYLAPELIDEMYKKQAHPKLGGEARIITAFFTDIQGFSSFSEKLTAEQLVELLNEYLSAMTDILSEDKGTLDKYEGDAIIAFFGAPMFLADHSLRACRVALAMQSKLGELRAKWGQEKLTDGIKRNVKEIPSEEWNPEDKWPKIVHDMRMRIGINTGEIVVGNMGSTMRMNYTMMGDPVNLAARLESAAKQYGVYILISEFTMNSKFSDPLGRKLKIADMLDYRFIDRMTVVGKSEPVNIFEPIALKGEMSEQDKKLCDIFAEGVECYFRTDWDNAILRFKQALKLERFPTNKTNPSKVFIERCIQFKAKPPVPKGQEWDGVYRLTSK